MICPRCGGYNCFRSHRRKLEYVLRPVGVLPWRCVDCQKRFYARLLPLRYLHLAHCPRCGNLDLLSIRREKLERNAGARLGTYLGARAVRCDFCRHNFVTWRPRRRRETRATASGFREQEIASDD